MSDIPWTWFVMRSSGLVAVGLLTIAVVLGVLGPLLRPTPRLTSISVHRAASIAGSILIVGHIVLAVLDKWIVLDLTAAFVPGLAGWERWGGCRSRPGHPAAAERGRPHAAADH